MKRFLSYLSNTGDIIAKVIPTSGASRTLAIGSIVAIFGLSMMVTPGCTEGGLLAPQVMTAEQKLAYDAKIARLEAAAQRVENSIPTMIAKLGEAEAALEAAKADPTINPTLIRNLQGAVAVGQQALETLYAEKETVRTTLANAKIVISDDGRLSVEGIGQTIRDAAPLGGPYAPWIAGAGTLIATIGSFFGGAKSGKKATLEAVQPTIRNAINVVDSVDAAMRNMDSAQVTLMKAKLAETQTTGAKAFVSAAQGKRADPVIDEVINL